MQIHLFIYSMLAEITVTGAQKETQEKENHTETTVTKIQPENPLSLYLPDLQ